MASRPVNADGSLLIISLSSGTNVFSGTSASFYDFKTGGRERKKIETTTYSSAGNESIPSTLVDPGTADLVTGWNPGSQGPITGAVGVLTLIYPPFGTNTGTTSTATNNPGSEAVSAWLQKMTPAMPIGNRMEATLTIQCTGAWSYTAAS